MTYRPFDFSDINVRKSLIVNKEVVNVETEHVTIILEIGKTNITLADNPKQAIPAKAFMNQYTFLDGSVCGVMEEY